MIKKISLLLSLFWGLVFANTIIDVSGEKTNLEINHENPEVIQINVNTGDVLITNKVTDHGDFTQLLLPNYHLSSDAGTPELPEIHRLIEIPQNASPRIEIISSKYQDYLLEDLGIINPIFPSQPSVSKSQKPEDITFIINSEVYSKNNLLGIPNIKNTEYYKVDNLEGFKRKFNIFTTRKSDKNIFDGLDWDGSIAVSGSVIPACVPKYHPQIKLLCYQGLIALLI